MNNISIRLQNIIIESLSNPHGDIPDDSKILAQLIVDESILWETLTVGKEEADPPLWRLEVDCTIPEHVSYFSIGVVGVSASKGTRLLGLLEIISREEVFASIERNESLIFLLLKVNHDGPSLKLKAEFTTVKSSSHPIVYQLAAVGTDQSLPSTLQIEYNSLKSENILPRLEEIYKTVETSNTSGDSLEMSVMYERILLLPMRAEKKPYLLNILGDIYDKLYETSNGQDVRSLNQAICAYHDAVRHCGSSLFRRSERLGDLSDLNQSIIGTGDLELAPNVHPNKASWLSNLSLSLFHRFQHLGDLSDLSQSIAMAEEAVHLTPDGHPNKPSRLNNLGNSLLGRFEQLGNVGDLSQSITMREEAIHLTPNGHLDKPTLLSNLGSSLFRQFERVGNLSDLNRSITMGEEAVHLTPNGHSDKLSYLNNLGVSLVCRFEQLGNLSDLNRSITIREEVVHLTPNGHFYRPLRLNNLSNSLLSRFKHLGNLMDLNQSITKREEAIRLTPNGHPHKHSRLNDLGNSFLTRFEQLGNLGDLSQSITMGEEALRLTPDDHPDKPSRLNSLGFSLFRRFERLGNLSDLNQSIAMQEEAVHLTPNGHLYKPSWLNNLGGAFLRRFERLGNLIDLSHSITMGEEAVHLTPNDHPDRPSRLSSLSFSLFRRFERLGDLSDLNLSTTMREEVVHLTSNSHPERPSRLNNLSGSLLRRFERLGNLSDLNQSITMGEKAVHLIPNDHPDKSSQLNNLGNSFLARFDRLGNIGDVNQSITMGEEALHLTPNDHPDKPARLNGLGFSLFRRFERLGDLNDLNQSITMREQAVHLTPNDHLDKPAQLNNLGSSLLRRFERLGDLSDLNQSVRMGEEAVRLTPIGHPDKPLRLEGLGASLFRRFARLGDLGDLNQSITTQEEAVHLTPNGHPDKPSLLSNLGNSLSGRFERLGNLGDINQSIMMKMEALLLTPNGHPDKPFWLMNLGNSLLRRFGRLSNKQDRIYSTNCFSSAALAVTGHPLVKFRASSNWAHLTEESEDSSHFLAYSTALSLLPQLAWLGSPVQDRHFYIREAGAIVRRAAVAAIEYDNLPTSVEWLEQGHSIIWGQLLNLRLPIDDLKSLHPELAQQLLSLSSKLEGANNKSVSPKSLSSTASVSHKSLDYHCIAHERELLINKIRQLSEFKYFLSPKPLSELTRAAQLGPVVMLNASERRCDALVLVHGVPNNVLHIPLPDISLTMASALHRTLQDLLKGQIPAIDMLPNSSRTSHRDIERLRPISQESSQETLEQVFQTMLRVIWDRVVKPIVQGLALTTDNPSRIWWCPTGPFSFLPLHAAGDYSQDAAVGSKLTDYAISSYIPSLTSLIQALNSMPNVPESPQFLAVTQPSAIGQTRLPGTLRELEHIEEQAKKKNIKIVSLKASDATVSRVKEEMMNASWVHFACHGVQDRRNPTESALLLSGSSRLTLSEIIGMKMPPKDLAFLSACRTATGDGNLSDETVHLAAGMLLAGYRGVLATMWSIGDWHAPTVANDVYAYLFERTNPNFTQAAEALHYAIQDFRGKPGISFLDWVPFIHMGL